MKHHDVRRPVGECKGCCLNSRTICIAGFQPKAVWSRGCKHFNDIDLLRQYEAQPHPSGAKLARQVRKAKASLLATQPHRNGVLAPKHAASRGR